jgi:hypothetical protein
MDFFFFLSLLDGLDFLKWNGTLAVDPFAIYVVLVVHINYLDNALDIFVSDEPKATWLLSSFVPHYHTIIHWSKLQEILTEMHLLKIMRQSTDKNLFILRIHIIQP